MTELKIEETSEISGGMSWCIATAVVIGAGVAGGMTGGAGLLGGATIGAFIGEALC